MRQNSEKNPLLTQLPYFPPARSKGPKCEIRGNSEDEDIKLTVIDGQDLNLVTRSDLSIQFALNPHHAVSTDVELPFLVGRTIDGVAARTKIGRKKVHSNNYNNN